MGQQAAPRTTLNFDGIPDATQAAPTPAAGTQPSAPSAPAAPAAPPALNFDGIPAAKRSILVNNDLPHQIGRQIYAAIPGVTATVGAALASAPFVLGAPWTAGSSAFAAPTAGLVGAGAGGMFGRGIQWVIDRVLNRDPLLQNDASAGEEATRQMAFEAGGQALAVPFRMLRGSGQPLTQEAAERAATAKQYDLKLSTPEITGGAFGERVQYAGARGIAGQTIQQRARERTQQSVDRAVGQILDSLGTQASPTEAGAAVQESLGRNADTARATVADAVNAIAPSADRVTTGTTTQAGVQAARRGFSEVQQQFNQIVADGPTVDIRPLKSQALRIFHEQIMPALQTVPDLGPNTKTFARLKELYAAGNIIELGAQTEALLNSEALKASTSPAIRTIRRILTAQDLQPFNAATKLRTALRESGKAPDELIGSEAKGVATTLATTLRGILAEAHPAWDAAAQAYGADARIFQSKFLRNLVGKDPEAVLTAVSGKSGQVNATRVQQLRRALLGVTKESPNAADHAAGEQAWNTLRSEWFRREIFQDDVFGLSDRMAKVDRSVLQAWFPDVPGKQVLARATAAASQFENTLLRQVAEADPAKVLQMVGATPTRVTQLRTALTSAPQSTAAWDRLRRAWTEQTLTAGDPAKLAERMTKTDPDLLSAWFPQPVPIPAGASAPQVAQLTAENTKRAANRQALNNLQRIGNALATQQPVPHRGLYEGVEATTIIGSLITGNPTRALQVAVGFEGVPAFLSWAIYQPQIQRYVLDATAPTLPLTTRTAALLRAASAWRAAQQSPPPESPQ